MWRRADRKVHRAGGHLGVATGGLGVRFGSLWLAAALVVGVVAASGGLAAAQVEPPDNDGFADAVMLSAASGSVEGTTVGATGEPGEADEYGDEEGESLTSVWYVWTATRAGTVVFDTCGSDYDTVLAAYTGSAVDDLVTIAANDDACALQSRIAFSVTSGVTYRIRVDGYQEATGEFLLTWSGPGLDCSGTVCTATFGFVAPDEGRSEVQEFTVPDDVCAVSIEAVGAQGAGWSWGEGGEANGGDGASAEGTVAATPGEILQVRVGGPGDGPFGGFNGGGDAGSWDSGGGGGASDVRRGGSGLGDRVIVAGGGGGAGTSYQGAGGDGGGETGEAGGGADDAAGGAGGGADVGGTGGGGVEGSDGGDGSDGLGGAGGGVGLEDEDQGGGPAGGGGGGGWRGGGGGGAGIYDGGGGGGGSGHGPLGVQYGVPESQVPRVRITYDTAAGTCVVAPPVPPPSTTTVPPTSTTTTTVPPPSTTTTVAPPPATTVPPPPSTAPPPPNPGPDGGPSSSPTGGSAATTGAVPELGSTATTLAEKPAVADPPAEDESETSEDDDAEVAAGASPAGGGGGRGGGGGVQQTSFVQTIPTPEDVDWGVRQVIGNLFLTLLILVLVAIPSTLVDSTIQENYERIFGGHPRLRQVLIRAEAGLTALPDGVLLAGLSVTAALIFGQLDADLGWNASSVVLVTALALVVAIVVGVHDLARLPYLNRRSGGAAGGLGVYPFALLLAIGLVALSKVVGFQPGFVFGVVGGLALSEAVSERDDGRSLAAAGAGLLTIAFVAWWLWRPVAGQVLEPDPGAWVLFLDAFLATLWLTALQSVVFGLAPVRFLDGDQVRRWNAWAWLTLWAGAVFLLVQCYLHPSASRWGGVGDNTMRSALSVFAIFLVAGVAFWAWFRFRPTPDPATDEALATAEP